VGVAPVIHDAIRKNDGSILIRISNGQPPGGGPSDEFAPYFLMNNAAINAASYDPKYQSLNDAVNSLNSSIDDIKPGQMAESLARVAAAGTGISRICSAVR
jgi:hypothetical protein